MKAHQKLFKVRSFYWVVREKDRNIMIEYISYWSMINDLLKLVNIK